MFRRRHSTKHVLDYIKLQEYNIRSLIYIIEADQCAVFGVDADIREYILPDKHIFYAVIPQKRINQTLLTNICDGSRVVYSVTINVVI